MYWTRRDVLRAVERERERQERLAVSGRWEGDSMATVSDGRRLAVLVEEVGEVAAALQGDGDLREELVQVAAVAVAWLEVLRD